MNRKLKIIACGVLAEEMAKAGESLMLNISEEYLPAGLHEEPDRLRKELQKAVDRVSLAVKEGREHYDAIIIGYGLCGRGTVGLRAAGVPLILPRVHDCIALFLGSQEKYKEQFSEAPGTFYMTSGWYKHKTQPMSVKKKKGRTIKGNWDISVGFDVIKKKYGRENAEEIYNFLNSWKKNYTRAVYIDTGSGNNSKYETYTRDLAKELNWNYEKIQGYPNLFYSMLWSEKSDNNILVVPPGQITAYDPAKNGLYAYTPGSRYALLWDRPLPVSVNKLKAGGRQISLLHRTRRGLGLGIDAGGTYTDAVIYDFDRSLVLSKAKAPTTRWNFTLGITEALRTLDPDLLSKVDITVVSTTLATNAIIENSGCRVGLILMPPCKISPGQISHNYWRIVRGRLTIQGDELEAIHEEEIRRTVAELIDKYKVEAFAVSGYGSTVNPVHELAIKKIIETETGLAVCCGHSLSNTLDFFIRANTAVLNVGIIPLVEQFIRDLEMSLKELDICGRVMFVRGDGSLMSREKAILNPIETTLSGPAASVAGAKFLTESSDAMIIDVGGTSSDIGIITNGRIKLTEKGARVGRWRTHIKAVDMSTLGTGGDSRILIDKGDLKIGPRRVVPVGRLYDTAGSMKAIDYITDIHSDFYTSTAAMEIFALTGRQAEWKLTGEEEKIIDVLSDRPHSVMELSIKIKHGLWNFLSTAGLEQSAVIQRYGLTPTDLLTAEGEIVLWPSDISIKVFRLYCTVLKTDGEGFIKEVFESITDNLLQTLVLQELDVPGDEAKKLTENRTFKTLLEKLKGQSRALALTPSLNTALIGVGAAASWLLKDLAGHLCSSLIIPENGDVANAVGAVCSMVTVKKEASVLPLADGKFLVSGLGESVRFKSFKDACGYLETALAEEVQTEAVKAGTMEKNINWKAENRISKAGNGDTIFLGREYIAEITGLPI
ncbi:MAG: DUF1638 domain-containing protein [Spirochaetaceae bacterium]|nr:DUF1638 domain-containing protein [Spirochaetaceae bacterium]